MMRIHLIALTLAVMAAACGDTIVQLPTTPGTPTPTPLPARTHSIELRVNGNATSVRVRFSNPVDGLTQVVTSLPYVAETFTTQSVFFLSLDVTPIAYPLFIQAPFLSAQIMVDGALFREATASDSNLNTLSVNGTWRSVDVATDVEIDH